MPWGHRRWQQPCWGAHSTLRHRCWQAPFWSPPSCLLVPEDYVSPAAAISTRTRCAAQSPVRGPGPAHQQTDTATAGGRAWQPTRPGVNLAYQCTHSNWPQHSRRAQAAHTAGAPRAHSSSDQRGICFGPHRTSTSTSPRWENVTNLPNTQK